jgi:hypothetical protein
MLKVFSDHRIELSMPNNPLLPYYLSVTSVTHGKHVKYAKVGHFYFKLLRLLLLLLLLPYFSGGQQKIGHLVAEMQTMQTDKPIELSCPIVLLLQYTF